QPTDTDVEPPPLPRRACRGAARRFAVDKRLVIAEFVAGCGAHLGHPPPVERLRVLPELGQRIAHNWDGKQTGSEDCAGQDGFSTSDTRPTRGEAFGAYQLEVL